MDPDDVSLMFMQENNMMIDVTCSIGPLLTTLVVQSAWHIRERMASSFNL